MMTRERRRRMGRVVGRKKKRRRKRWMRMILALGGLRGAFDTSVLGIIRPMGRWAVIGLIILSTVLEHRILIPAVRRRRALISSLEGSGKTMIGRRDMEARRREDERKAR